MPSRLDLWAGFFFRMRICLYFSDTVFFAQLVGTKVLPEIERKERSCALVSCGSTSLECGARVIPHRVTPALRTTWYLRILFLAQLAFADLLCSLSSCFQTQNRSAASCACVWLVSCGSTTHTMPCVSTRTQTLLFLRVSHVPSTFPSFHLVSDAYRSLK